jgi:hypothetical protein
MAQTSVPAAGTSPFAHLARAAGVAAVDDDKAKKAAAASDDDDKKDDKDDKKDDKAKKAKAEESDEDDDDKKDDDSKSKKAKGKKAKVEDDEDEQSDAKAEGDDDSDRDDDTDAKARAARSRERGRIQAIVLSDAGKKNPVAAMTLACGGSMSRKQAINLLQAMGPAAAPGKRDGLGDRMATVEQPDIGDDGAEAPAAGSHTATAAAILAAGKKARGEV